MRKKIYHASPARGRELLNRADHIHLATVSDGGMPVLKTVHGVLLGDCLYWHGSPGGEKARCTGHPVVICAMEMVADIPSHWIDPERACPATTYYESVQVHGTTETVSDPLEAASVLQALMDRYQPEGGFTPIRHDHPLYDEAIRRLLVTRVSLERITAKSKLGQNRTPCQIAQIVTQLWRRGSPRDLSAIERLLDAHPAEAVPRFLTAPRSRLVPDVRAEADLDAAARMLLPTYWNRGRFDAGGIRAAVAASSAVVGARCVESGELIAIARAVSDDRKRAWIYDVCVDSDRRHQGLGSRVMALLLDHPRVRDCAEVHLGTRDAQGFYARLGFGARSIEMVLKRR